jgi:hypothetical protein
LFRETRRSGGLGGRTEDFKIHKMVFFIFLTHSFLLHGIENWTKDIWWWFILFVFKQPIFYIVWIFQKNFSVKCIGTNIVVIELMVTIYMAHLIGGKFSGI